VASILIALGTFEEIVAYFVFVTVAFVGITVAGTYVLRSRPAAPSGVYCLPGYPVTPGLFLLLTALVLALLGSGRPTQALVGVIVVASGAPVYGLLGMRRRAKVDERGEKA
jgi:basic amino acid/polyamine antiporter, APA family